MSTIQRVLYELVGVDRASPAFEKAGLSAERMESRISKLGRGIALAGAAIGAGAVAIGVESVKAATAFQTSMTKISTQAGGTRKDVQVLSKEVLALGTKTQQGPQELADSLYHLKSVGLSNVAAMKALRAASDLAAVGGASLEDTTNAIAGAWRSGIKGAQSFGQAAATVNAIIGAGNMRMTDFIDAIGTGILPSARAFGVSLKSVGAALALMTDEGIPANSAATRLRMSLSLLGAPSAVASKQLATIGLTGLKLANAMRGPQGIIGAIGLLKSHLDASGLSASQSAQLLSHAFGGGRSSSAILTLINNFDVLKRKQDQINKSMGNFGPAVTEQRKTAAAQFALLRSNIDVIGIRIGLALLPPVTKFAHFLAATVVPGAETAARRVGKVFNQVIPVKSIEADWHRLMRFLGLEKAPKPKARKLAWSDIWHIQDSGVRPSPLLPGKWKPAPVKVNSSDLLHITNSGGLPKLPGLDTFMGGPVKVPSKQAAGMAAGIGSALSKVNWGKVLGKLPAQLVSGVFGALSKINWGSMASKFAPPALEFIINFAAALLDPMTWLKVIKSSWPALLSLILTAITIPIGGEGGTIFKALADIFEHIPILKLAAPLLRAADRLFAPLNKGFQRLLGKAFSWVGRLGGDLLGKLLTGLDATFPRITRWLVGGLALIEGLLKRFPKATLAAGILIIRGLWHGMVAGWNAVTGFLGKVQDRVHGYFSRAVSWLLTSGGNIITGLWHGLTGKWPVVTGFIGKIGGRILAPLRMAGRWLLDTGGNVILGLLHGITAKMAGIASWVKGNIVDPVINWVKHFFGIHSPSTVMHGLGFNVVAGLLRGMMSHDIGGFVSKVFGSIPKALGSIVKKGLVSIESLPGKALKALGGLGGDILGFLGLGGGDSGARTSSAAVAQRYAASLLSMYGWSQAQMGSLIPLWNQESGWNADAVNPSSGAYGIPQCYSTDMMILTRRGWLKHNEVQVGDETVGYNEAAGRSEWTRITAVLHPGVHPVVRYGNSQVEFTTTPNHRWLMRDKRVRATRPAEQMREIQDRLTDSILILAKPHYAEDGLPITLEEAALLGWIAGDGWERKAYQKYGTGRRGGSPATFHIGQTKQENWPDIERALAGHGSVVRTRERTVNGEPRLDREWRLSAPYARDLAERAGNPKTDHRAMILAMSSAQRKAWLDAMFLAEGSFDRRYNHRSISQNDGALAETIRLAVYLEGYRPSVYKRVDQRYDSENLIIGFVKPTLHVGHPGFFYEDAGEQEVWCVTTELGTFTAEQNGHIHLTGNSLGHGHPYNLGDYKNQIIWGLNYIRQRYGSPAAAWAHEERFNWYAGGTGIAGAKPGWAVVGERGPELVKFSGGEHVLDHGTSKAMASGLPGYAKGTDLAKLGRELLHRRHSGVLDNEISRTSARYRSDHLLANAPGGRHRHHYAKLAAEEHRHLKSLEHTRAAERAYRAVLARRVTTLEATIKAARHAHLPGEAAHLTRKLHRAQRIIHDIDLWIAGKPRPKTAPKPKPKPGTVPAPTGNLDIADWAAYLDAIHGGAPGLAAYKTGSWFVPATAPAVVHRGEMILPADVAQAVRDAASGGNGGGGQFTGTLYLDSGELLGVVDGRIERSDRKFNRRVAAGTGRR